MLNPSRKISIPPFLGHKVIFILCVVVPTFNNFELTFACWFLAAVLTLRNRYSVTIGWYVITTTLILLLAFMSSFFNEFKFYNWIRDLTYLLKPILGILLGYQLLKDSKSDKPLKLVVLCGVILAFLHFFKLFAGVAFYNIRNIHDLRFYAGYFSDLEVFALIILLFSKKFNLDMPHKQRRWMILLLSISILLYLARTNFLQFGVLAIAMLGYFRITKRAIKVGTAISIVTLVVYFVIYNSNPRRSASGFEAFLYKVKIAPIEPFKMHINEDDWKDFNDNYRSFENIITVEQVSASGTDAVIFGKGLGSTVDLRREIWTNDLEFIRYLPTVHNSYMTIFLKAGVLGVLLMLIFIYLLLRYRRSDNEAITAINYLLVGTGIFLILSNWVFMGLYFKVDNKAILIGFLIAYREVLWKRLRRDQANLS